MIRNKATVKMLNVCFGFTMQLLFLPRYNGNPNKEEQVVMHVYSQSKEDKIKY